jgi:hypothetical protein
MTDADKLKILYRALDIEHPLDIDKPEDKAIYVENLHKSNGYDPIDELQDKIDISDRPNSWLFTGHRGVGKSTELRRLAVRLRESNHLVMIADVNDYLNLSEPISTESLLLTVIAALADEADKLLGGKRLEQGYFARFRAFLTDTEFTIPEVTINMLGGASSAKVMLTQTPNLLEQIKKATDGATARLWERIKAFAKEIVNELEQHSGTGGPVVLILDSLERLRVTGSDAHLCYDAISRTFSLNGLFLKFDSLHVVYSVPPYLPYLIPRVGSDYGYGLCTLPQVKVFETPIGPGTSQTAQPSIAGMALMVGSIEKRYPGVAQLIPIALLEELALASSGSMRDFFRLIRSVCTKARVTNASLPLAGQTLSLMAQGDLRSEMPLAEDDKVWLRKVRETHGTGLESIENLHQLARLFDCGVILNYRNGKDWCDVHYLLHDQLA